MKKPKENPDEPPIAWVAREPKEWGLFYYIFSSKPRRQKLGGWSSRGKLYAGYAKNFHRLFPNIRLKPGEGPIKVRLRAEIVE